MEGRESYNKEVNGQEPPTKSPLAWPGLPSPNEGGTRAFPLGFLESQALACYA